MWIIKARFAVCLLAAFIASAKAVDQDLTVYAQALSRTQGPPLHSTEEAVDGFRKLVAAGEEGWQLLFDLEFNTSSRGDVTRFISSLWDGSGIPQDLLKRFLEAEGLEKAKRAKNETWALLYADAHARCINSRAIRHISYFEQLQREFRALTHPDLQRPLLLTVASLRVDFADKEDFPGHVFPWNGTKKQKGASIKQMLNWWQVHSREFENE
jgi:hypothetical protein